MISKKKSSILVFLITSFIISAQNEQILDTTILKNITHKIHSIDIVNDNTDLVFLKDELGLAEIFMLGEQSHGDGSTFLAKTRLIKYLMITLKLSTQSQSQIQECQ